MKTIHYPFIPIIMMLSTMSNNLYSQFININVTLDSQTDGSFKLNKKDSAHLKAFNIDNSQKTITYKSKEFIDFEFITSSQIKEIFKQNEYTWVFIQSSWCGGCTSSLRKYLRVSDSLSNRIKVVVINQDIRVKKLQYKIYSEGYKNQPYVLDPKKYGTYEPDKQSKFISELTDIQKLENYNSGSVPKNLIFNREGELVYFGPNDLNAQLIKEKVFKEK